MRKNNRIVCMYTYTVSQLTRARVVPWNIHFVRGLGWWERRIEWGGLFRAISFDEGKRGTLTIDTGYDDYCLWNVEGRRDGVCTVRIQIWLGVGREIDRLGERMERPGLFVLCNVIMGEIIRDRSWGTSWVDKNTKWCVLDRCTREQDNTIFL